jgi:hypothetical protein
MDKKVSPPFEGGVIGTIDYHIDTVFSFPTGVVDSLNSSDHHSRISPLQLRLGYGIY